MKESELPPNQINKLLEDYNNGNKEVIDQLIPLVEMELRRIAHNFMRKEEGNHTLQTTALVNEAYLKLIEQREIRWQNSAHFFGISAQIMRRILLNHARDKIAQKRGGGSDHMSLDEVEILSIEKSLELVALDEALNKLTKVDPLKSRIVELRYFTGLTLEETAEVLQIAPNSISFHWRLAKAWLAREINLYLKQ